MTFSAHIRHRYFIGHSSLARNASTQWAPWKNPMAAMGLNGRASMASSGCSIASIASKLSTFVHFPDRADRPDLDAPHARGRYLCGDLYGFVQVGRVDQVEAGELLLGLGEGPVGDGHLPVPHAYGRGGLDGLEGLRGDAVAAGADGGVVRQAVPVVHRLQLLFFAVNQAEIFHEGSDVFRNCRVFMGSRMARSQFDKGVPDNTSRIRRPR